MKRMHRFTTTLIFITLVSFASSSAVLANRELHTLLDFAAEMAEEGNWREAQYRWEKALPLSDNHPRVLNNLAVSAEILGDFETAEEYYLEALSQDSKTAALQDNAARFDTLRRRVLANLEGITFKPIPYNAGRLNKVKGNRSTILVNGSFTLPPKLETEGYDSLLVASFIVENASEIDLNREVTRYLRKRLAKGSLDVLPVTPAPAIPEMPIEDLIKNAEFWKFLGRQHSADVIVSGELKFATRDASGYENVDVVNQRTGQKVRQSRFVEQKEFRYTMEVFFIESATGKLLHRDSLQRAAIYAGGGNDSLSAFFELLDALARDVAAVVAPRIRQDTRFIFKR